MSGAIWFLIEALLYGAFWVYLVLVVPAALVAGLKQDWVLFLLGFVSFGVAWFASAALRAKPGSWWERHFYPDELVRDETALAALRRRRRRLVFSVVGSALVLVGLFSARPSPVLGIDGESLQYSVGAGGILTFSDRCRPREDGSWTCFNFDSPTSSEASYRVEVDGVGCWRARNSDPPRFAPEDQQLTGCVTVFDHIRFLNLLFP